VRSRPLSLALVPFYVRRNDELTATRSTARSQYPCIDPAPAATHSPLVASAHSAALAPAAADLSIPELERQLMDTTLSLFDRYRAMFALRNVGDREAVLALARGFEDDSALFRCVLRSLSLLPLSAPSQGAPS